MEYPLCNDIIGPTSWTTEEKVIFVETSLQSTARVGIDKVIEYLRNSDFYYAPSSTKFHSNYQGGLLDHSILVLSTAAGLRDAMVKMKPELVDRLTDESLIISCLLHDLCKVGFYVPKEKWKKDENDKWVSYRGYDVEDTFPIGHGEKSVILLQWLGLSLTIDEMLAIRYHMGLWSTSVDCGDANRAYFRAVNMCPLLSIVQNADFMSSNMLEIIYQN
jgi:hypothetical protein